MDFFEHQEVARRNTGRLVVLMILAVLGITALVFGVVVVAYLMMRGKSLPGGGDAAATLSQLPLGSLLGGTFVAVVTLVGGGSLYKTSQLAGGGKVVARSLGGRPVGPDTTDPDERRLLNVVEEMAIASGSPVPRVYLLDHEDGINAFAAGWSLDDAVIGVTRGCVQNLTRDELQGVVAHEFSHILHGDMRINLRLVGLIFGILVISVIGGGVMRSLAHGTGRVRTSSRSRDNNGAALVAVFVLGLALYLIGYVGVFFGRIIQAAVSRQREFLADASAVQYTRNPEGIGNALRRIGGLAQGARLQTAHASEHRHLFFGDSARRSFTRLFATHPPLPDRVDRVMPGWDGTWLGPRAADEQPDEPADNRSKNDRHNFGWRRVLDRATRPYGLPTATALAGLDQPATSAASAASDPPPAPTPPLSAVDHIGRTSPAHVAHAVSLIQRLPPEVYAATQTTPGAMALTLALLLDREDADVRRRQVAWLQDHVVGPVAAALERLIEPVHGLHAALRLPLLDLALPTLRSLPPREQSRLQEMADVLIELDSKLVLFEWALRQVLARQLNPDPPRARGRGLRLRDCADEAAMLLQALAGAAGNLTGFDESDEADAGDPATSVATLGSLDTPQSQRAYAAAVKLLPIGLPEVEADAPPTTIRELSRAVERLMYLRPLDQRALLRAGVAAVAADRQTTLAESELLRAVAEALGIPIPPLLAGQRWE